MASLINQQITLDLIPGPVVKTVSVSQYDTGTRTLQFKIQNDGVDFTIPSGITASIEATKKDLTGFSYPCTISGSMVSVVVQPQMTVFPGKTMCEIVFKQGNDRIGTANFWLKVEDAALNDSTIISETDIPGIANLSEAVRTAVESAESAEQNALDAEAWAVGTRDGVAVEETDPAYHNNSKYYSETFEGDVDRIEALVQQAEALAASIYSIGIVESASGDPASFTDGASNVPMKSVSVSIEPVQSGSGDPSPDNVRPISGWDAVKVTRAGKNLVDISLFATEFPNYCTYNDNILSATTHSTLNLTGINADIPSGAILSFTINNETAINVRVRFVFDDDTFYDTSTSPYQTTKHIKAIRFNWSNRGTFTVSNFQAELGSTATEYEPYQGQTYTISLSSAGTVYGGTLDAVTGKLVVDRKMVDLGSLTWTYVSALTMFYAPLVDSAYFGTDGDINAICSAYKRGNYPSDFASGSFIINDTNLTTQKRVNIMDTRYTDATEFKTAVTGQTLVYTLATPIEYQLTPTEVTTLLGTNNVWADCGEISIEYVADTKLYIQKLGSQS